MDLVLSVAALCAACILATVVLLAVNRPRTPFWASDGMVANVWLLLLVGLVAFGGAFGLRFVLTLSEQSLGLAEVASAVAFAAVTAVVIRLLAPRRRLLAYAAVKAASQVAEGGAGPAGPERGRRRASAAHTAAAPRRLRSAGMSAKRAS